jgi:hypothetical protein
MATRDERGVREEMTSAPGPNNGAAAADARHNLREEFHEIYERLYAMVDEYDDDPDSIDNGILTDDVTVNVEVAIIEAYKMIKTRVFAEDSPLRTDDAAMWTAFQSQKDELATSYRSARQALKEFREGLQAHGLLRKKPLSHGSLDRFLRDGHVLGVERSKCIDAVAKFYGVFSGMLTLL